MNTLGPSGQQMALDGKCSDAQGLLVMDEENAAGPHPFSAIWVQGLCHERKGSGVVVVVGGGFGFRQYGSATLSGKSSRSISSSPATSTPTSHARDGGRVEVQSQLHQRQEQTSPFRFCSDSPSVRLRSALAILGRYNGCHRQDAHVKLTAQRRKRSSLPPNTV